MAQTIHFPWGDDELKLNLPDSWRILGTRRPEPLAAPDPETACGQALAEPVGARRIGDRDLSGRRVVLAVDDHSRPTPVAEFIRPVLAELEQAGAADDDIEILIATGVHRPSRPEEVRRKLGEEVAARYRWRCHDAYDPDQLADLGTTSRGTHVFLNRLLTEADLIVTVGAIEPHLLLGFGGGLKMIIPGCAGARTIGRNHMQGAGPERFDYVGAPAEASPMRQDLEEGALKLEKDIFAVNAVMNDQARPVRFFCGDPVAAHRAGTEFIQTFCRLEVTEPADVVLANSHPMNLDLRQSIKCLGNSLYAAKEGGMLLGCLKCEEGLGEMPLAAKTLPYPVMRSLLGVIGKKRILPLVERVKKNEPVEEVFIGHFGMRMLRRNHLGLFSDSAKLPDNVGRRVGLARSFTRTDDLIAWAAAKAPQNATVWVFPHGGAGFVPGPWED